RGSECVMTQLGETVAFGMVGGDLECPFDHDDMKPKARTNVMPKWEANSAELLEQNMEDKHLEPHDITVDGEDLQAHYTPHHLIPGNASWPNTELQKWVDKRKNHIKEN